MKPKEIDFCWPNEGNSYQLFSEEMEANANVVFHGTTESRARDILREGFSPDGELSSSSFATTSSVPLGYACNNRSQQDRGAVLAVRFESLDVLGIRKCGDAVYLDDYSISYEILEYTFVSNEYKHI
jgi:RNA:NAD 2'-phosphotransferase (TPT1/KptA family)